MFDYLRPFSKIIVTGAQRSGTTICAQMIAHDLSLPYVDEDVVQIANWKAIKALVDGPQEFVLQCPRLLARVHDYTRPDVAIIFMLRNIADIIKSENRIGWGPYRREELSLTGYTHGVVSYIKRRLWFKKQKRLIHNPFEIVYESLKAHPFWVNTNQRKWRWHRDTFVNDINGWLKE